MSLLLLPPSHLEAGMLRGCAMYFQSLLSLLTSPSLLLPTCSLTMYVSKKWLMLIQA